MKDVTPLPSRYGLALAAAFAFALTNCFSNGAYDETALIFVVIGVLVVTGTYLVGLRNTPGFTTRGGALLGLAWVALFAMQFAAWNDRHLIMYAREEWTTGRIVEVASMALLLTYLPSLARGHRDPRWLRDGRMAVFALLVIAAGVATYRVSPRPAIDVWTVQQSGADALLHGKNPFTATAVEDTAPGVRQHVPYVYPPMQVYLTLLSYAIAHDVRYTMLAAVLLTGLALRRIVQRSGKPLSSLAEDAPALFLWLSPKMFFILEQAWIDPAQIALIALATWITLTGKRTPAALAWGVVLAAKQTMFWVAPLAGFTFRWRLRDWIVAGAVAIGAYLPFMIWDFHAWKYSNFDFLTALPARNDALSLTNWAQRHLGGEWTGKGAFPAAGLVVLGACLRNRGVPSKFGVALAATYTVFFVFNKWAFANYYYSLLGLSCLAAALAFHDELPKELRA